MLTEKWLRWKFYRVPTERICMPNFGNINCYPRTDYVSFVFCCYRELHATFRYLHYPDGWESPCQLSILNLPEVYSGVSPTSVSHGKRDTFSQSSLDQLLQIHFHMLQNFTNQELSRTWSPKNRIPLWLLRFMGCHLLQWNTDHFLR